MKNLLKNVSLTILLFKSCLLLGQDLDTKKIIVIDPGHGGKDSGAIGINSIQEKDVVLDIALEIVNLNKMSKMPMDVYLTRYRDTLISLSDRSKLAKALNIDLFISLHCNHSQNPNARGMEVYVGRNGSGNSKESVWFAYQLQNQFKKHLGFESRGVKFANFQVLRETDGHFPSALLELGFLSNGDESGYLLDNGNIRALALAVLMGLLNSFNSGF